MPDVAYKDTYELDEPVYRIPMLHSDVNILRRDVDTLKTNVSELKHDSHSVTADITELKSNVRILQNDSSTLKTDVRDLRVEVSDLKGDVRTLGARLDSMDRRIDDLHESQTKWFTLLGLLVTIVPIAIAIVQKVFTH